MHVVVMGAGIIGISTAWYLLDEGHTVTVIDRQPGAALETSFANGSQISVSYCEPWASPQAPAKVFRWMGQDDAPLLFRPHFDPYQWRWGLNFMAQCTPASFMRNTRQLVALGRFSHDTLNRLVAETGIEFNRVERGILHFFTDPADMVAGARSAGLMRELGVMRHVLTRDGVIDTEPSLAHFGPRILGGIYTPSDESGDAHVFTRELAERCARRGARMLYRHQVDHLDIQGGGFGAPFGAAAGKTGSQMRGVRVRDLASGQVQEIQGDAFVAALGSYTAPLLRPAGVDLDIYPTKGYSATLRLLKPESAASISLLDSARKIAISRLGDCVRIAGTAEMAGYDTGITGPMARARCNALVSRFNQIFPGVADVGAPLFWAGLRPSTPSNVPLIGRTRVNGLWINSGHGTLGWTHGAGSGRALALLMSGKRPELDFGFLGHENGHKSGRG